MYMYMYVPFKQISEFWLQSRRLKCEQNNNEIPSNSKVNHTGKNYIFK